MSDITPAAESPRPISVRRLHPRLRLDPRAVARAIRVLDENHDRLAASGTSLRNRDELSIAFLTDPELAALHGRFLNDGSATDVITFEGDPSMGTAGEICVSADAAARVAGRGRGFAEELTLYLAHGWLHLAGHDDLRPDRKRLMRRAEARALRALREAEAIPRFALSRA